MATTSDTDDAASSPAAAELRIFLSYRRTDDSNFVGRLYDQLAAAFGETNVFRDIDSIDAGANFNAKIHEALGLVDVVLVVIGPKWMAKRLSSDTDFVRMEIRGALVRNKQIVPVLIDNTPLPDPDALPADIRPLLDLNVARVRRDPDFRRDVLRLTESLAHLGGKQPSESAAMSSTVQTARSDQTLQSHAKRRFPASTRSRWAVVGLAGLLAAVALTAWIAWPTHGQARTATSESSARSTVATSRATPTLPAPSSTTPAATDSTGTSAAGSTVDTSIPTVAITVSPPGNANTTGQPGATGAAAAPTPSAGAPEATAPQTPTASGPCVSGFVLRAAVDGDTVCAAPSSHQAAIDDNAAAAERLLGLTDGVNGPDTCKSGYVWRDAWSGDHVCVTPDTRARAAADNAAAESRKQGLLDGEYGPDTCKSGYVWRDAWSDDHVCVIPPTRAQAAADNAAAASRVQPGGGAYGPDTCKSGFVWRDARTNPPDHVCVTGDIRQQAANDNAAADSTKLGKVYGPYGPDGCKSGFVWRDARTNPPDHVCVTGDIRQQAADDNAAADSRKLGKTYGPDGPDTCKPGFVWRLAVSSDHVCVTADRAAQTQAENTNRAATTRG